jgi:hypothetical protein
VGTGPEGSVLELTFTGDMVLEADGNILVTEGGNDQVLRVDPVTGDRTEVSGPGMGGGPTMVDTFSIDVDLAGTIFVADGTLGLVQIDPISGLRVILSSSAEGMGIPIPQLRDVRLGPAAVAPLPFGAPWALVVVSTLMLVSAGIMLARREQTSI